MAKSSVIFGILVIVFGAVIAFYKIVSGIIIVAIGLFLLFAWHKERKIKSKRKSKKGKKPGK